MTSKEKLLTRLAEIGDSLAQRENALALIGLGSVGEDMDRLDEYSDLDFFAIVKDGSKASYLNELSWLSDIAPIAYIFRNTPDGYKLLYEDGVFCEFAVFEMEELFQAAYAPGRILWKADVVDEDIRIPHKQTPPHQKSSVEWLVGEALTNLYVGLCRDKRGEKLSACRFIQGYAVDRILELAEYIAEPAVENQDQFDLERRFEQRFPEIAEKLPVFVQGYERNAESAQEILDSLDAHFGLNPAMKAEILKLVITSRKA
ncbi:MAG: hypothetical protein V2J07_06140 [Anaerolineae bacterium]|jgi:hypothetical protein|nr:hypothetical protein [Anaerolineae bacterium]